jgi:hypothetical protein
VRFTAQREEHHGNPYKLAYHLYLHPVLRRLQVQHLDHKVLALLYQKFGKNLLYLEKPVSSFHCLKLIPSILGLYLH